MNSFKDIAINYWLGYTFLPSITRVKLLKEYGFNSVEIYWTNEYQELNGDKYEIANNCIKYGISIDCLHATFNRANLLWVDSLDGEKLFNEYMQTILDAKNLNCRIVVIHANGKGDSKVFLKRINKLNDFAKKIGVTLCVENLQHNDNIEFVCQKTNLSLCFDAGHYNINQSKIILKHLKRVKYIHIHDNDGKHDLHLIPGDGHINFNDKTLSKILTLDCPKLLEVHDFPQDPMSKEEYEKYLKKVSLFLKTEDCFVERLY